MTELRALHSEKVGPALTGQRIDKPCDHEYQWVCGMLHAERRGMVLAGWTLVAANPAPLGHDILWRRPKRDCPIPLVECPTMDRIDHEAASCEGVTS